VFVTKHSATEKVRPLRILIEKKVGIRKFKKMVFGLKGASSSC